MASKTPILDSLNGKIPLGLKLQMGMIRPGVKEAAIRLILQSRAGELTKEAIELELSKLEWADTMEMESKTRKTVEMLLANDIGDEIRSLLGW